MLQLIYLFNVSVSTVVALTATFWRGRTAAEWRS